MMISAANSSTVKENSTAGTLTPPGERDSVPLTEAELDSVVGAGSKPGASSGAGLGN